MWGPLGGCWLKQLPDASVKLRLAFLLWAEYGPSILNDSHGPHCLLPPPFSFLYSSTIVTGTRFDDVTGSTSGNFYASGWVNTLSGGGKDDQWDGANTRVTRLPHQVCCLV